MLVYVYTLDYDDTELSSPFSGSMNENESDDSTAIAAASPTLHTHQKDVDALLDLARRDSEAPATNDVKSMNNVLVYAIAEKYDIPELKQLAREKFIASFSQNRPPKNLSAIAKAVFETTPSGDEGLRQIVIQECLHWRHDWMKDPVFMSILKETGDLATGILTAAVQNYDRIINIAHEALVEKDELMDVLKEELSRSKREIREAADQKEEWFSDLKRYLDRANEYKSCRHCRVEFNSRLDPNGSNDYLGMQMRCGSCRTKHSLA